MSSSTDKGSTPEPLTGNESRGGHRLLLQLGDDALGRSFCATRAGAEGSDQLVLLRVFDHLSISPTDAWNLREARRGVEGSLLHPSIGTSTSSGVDQGALWSAYEYVQGTTLSRVIAKAKEQARPVPTELVLLVASKIASALSTAARTEELGEPLAHGFLVPELVMVSNEGAVRLLGFEVSLALRRFDRMHPACADLRAALRPKTRQRNDPKPADDLYAFGSLLSTLLTHSGFAVSSEADRLAAIRTAREAGSGKPLDPGLLDILERCALAGSETETTIGDLLASIKTLIVEGGYRPSYHSLAVYLDDLMSDAGRTDALKTRQIPLALAREVQENPTSVRTEPLSPDSAELRVKEVEELFASALREETDAADPEEVPAPEAPEAAIEPEPDAGAVVDDRDSSGGVMAIPVVNADEEQVEGDDPVWSEEAPGSEGRSRRGLVWAVLLAAATVVLGAWLLTRFSSQAARTPSSPARSADAESAPVPAAPGARRAPGAPGEGGTLPLGESSDESSLDLNAVGEPVGDDAEGVPAEAFDLAAEPLLEPPADDELGRQDAPAESREDRIRSAAVPDRSADTGSTASVPTREPRAPERPRVPARELSSPREATRDQATTPVRETPTPAPAEPLRPSASESQSESESGSVEVPPLASTPAAAEAAPGDSSSPAEALAAAPTAEVPAAESVFVPPKLLQLDPPEYPLLARRAKVEGTVKMVVLVGVDGRVKSVEVREGVGRAKLDQAAMAAARKAIFQPATRDGVPVESQGEVEVQFRLD